MFLQLSSKKENILACERKMDLFLTGVFRRVLAALLLCSIIQKSESFRISRSPSNPKIVVLGVNSDRVELEWRYSDAPSSYLVNLFRQKPDESPVQLAVSKDGNAFKPGSTREFEANLDAILTLKNVKRDEEYSYFIQLTDLSDGWVKDQNKVVIKVVVPPEITDPPETAPLLTIGENHTLTCNASGDPLPNITWTKDGIPAEEFNVTGYKLHLTDVKLKDVGSYRCKASNGYGDDATSVSIASIRCDDCEIKTVGITLQSESWKSALNNQQSVEFKTLKANVLSEITKVYAKNPGKEMFGVGLVAFRSGSVVAEVEMKFGKSVTDPLKPLEDEIKDGKLGAFTVNRELELNITPLPPTSFSSTATPPPASFFPTTSKEPDQPSNNAPYSGLTPSELWGIILGCIAVVLVVIIIIVVSPIYCRKNKGGVASKGGRKKYSEVDGYPSNLRYHRREDRIDIQGQECPQENQHTRCTNVGGDFMLNDGRSPPLESQSSGNPTYEQILVSSEYMPLNQATKSPIWEIRREQVHIMEMIGKGAFSQVAKAVAFLNINGTEGQITVAVKMLKENAPESDRKDLLSELELMKKLKPHPHVIKLMGCITNSDPLLVLIEHIPYGDLLGYLRKSRGLNDTYFKDPDVKPETNLTSEQLVRFAWQIADGMKYLSSKKIIHRDLAARNVLVGEGEGCKVTDFGMARNVGQDDIYTRRSGVRLPVKWTAYEGLLYGTYTTQSDVWSFGVVLYEIFTIGGSPYPGIKGHEIADKLQKGYRMQKPKHVDEQLYQIMFQCWQEDPNLRPTFSNLADTLKKLIQNQTNYVNMEEYDNNLYANIDDLL